MYPVTSEPNELGASPPRRVLMVACAFPPTGGPGVQRTAKFAKFLPQLGWTPYVWSASALPNLPRDACLLDDLPSEAVVHRHALGSAVPPHLSGLRAGTYFGEFLSRLPFAAVRRVSASPTAEDLPDEYIGWARSSVSPLLDWVERDDVEVIYSTYSPASNHWLALELVRRTGLPWVADFRDLWTDDYRYRESSPRRRAAHEALQQEILEVADVVLGVSERQTQILAGHVSGQVEKFHTITNGYDPDDFRPTDCARSGRGEVFVLSHVGRLDRWRASDVWFAGLRQFIERIGEDRTRFVLRIVGHADTHTQAQLRETGAECAVYGYVSHDDAVGEMGAADALLLCVPDGRNADSVIPAKLFEYLASQRPMLVVGPEGECSRIVGECRAGIIAGCDESAIAGGLIRLFEQWKAGRPLGGCPPARLWAFDRRRLTGTLAELLAAAAEKRGAAAVEGRVWEHIP